MRATPGRLLAAEREAGCRLCLRRNVETPVTTEMLMDRVQELRAQREAMASRNDLLEAADRCTAEANRLRAIAARRPDLPGADRRAARGR